MAAPGTGSFTDVIIEVPAEASELIAARADYSFLVCFIHVFIYFFRLRVSCAFWALTDSTAPGHGEANPPDRKHSV